MHTDSLSSRHTTSLHAGGTGRLANHTVSRIGYGAMQLERLADDHRAAVALLRRIIELGVTHIDTAQFYGDGVVNDMIRDALTPDDNVVVVTKVGADPSHNSEHPIRTAQRPDQLRSSVEDNLRSLGLDQIPVVNLRRFDVGPGLTVEGDQIVDIDDQIEVMTNLRDEGKIGAIGLSCVSLDSLQRALPVGIACVQNWYSLIARDHEDMLELCSAENVAWVPFFPLGSAFPQHAKVTDEPRVRAVADKLGTSPALVGLAWLLRHSPNTLLIPGSANLSHMETNLTAGDVPLTDSMMSALGAIPS
ncbi:aldo/keto reductase [Paramicrobacterium agarici]|uniref:Aryl-alcohol dehydrogenase-like predicted oxidoreductase n=1 Tax=Paramicrobacterium agarici TaxID=630514 RepID=A0A2A9DZY8_9MICO|nr:aldo/keto reductase [Microbacterium agarici]PFG31695.1 aryl-alcohol dehydrogenase-like predicted oxidoreductase [Microbacterium agarici]